MVIITSLFWFAAYTYGPILTAFCLERGASLGTTGIILSSYGLMQLILRAPVGMLSDAVGKRKLFVWAGLGACLLSGIAFLLAKGPVALFAARGLTGVAMASWSVFVSLYCGFSDEGNYSKMMGTINMLMALHLLGVFFGGIIAQRFGYEATFAATIAASALAIILLFFVRENAEPKAESAGFGRMLAVMKDGTLWYYAVLALVVSVVNYTSVSGFIPALLQQSGANSFQMGLGTTLGLIPVLLAAPVACTVIPRKFGFMPTIIGGFLLMTVPVILLPMTSSIPLMLALETICGVGRGVLFPLFTEQATIHFPAAMRSSAMGAFQAIYSIGMFIGPALTGLLSEWFSLKTGFLFLGGVGMLAALLIALFGKRTRNVALAESL